MGLKTSWILFPQGLSKGIREFRGSSEDVNPAKDRCSTSDLSPTKGEYYVIRQTTRDKGSIYHVVDACILQPTKNFNSDVQCMMYEYEGSSRKPS